MLLASDETLERFIETDQKIKHRDKEGRPVTYGELLEKADPKMANWSRPRIWSSGRTRRAPRSATCARSLGNANLDALIVFGDDQNESYLEDCRPAFAIYFGETIRNDNKQHEHLFAPAGVVHQEPRGLLRAGQAARLSGALRPRAAPDRTPDGRRFRSGGVEVPARRAKAKATPWPMCTAT